MGNSQGNPAGKGGPAGKANEEAPGASGRAGQSGTDPTRTVVLVGPAGTGKTSLAEALLHASGMTGRLGSVPAGTSLGDTSPEARARGGSTELNLFHCDWLGDRFALIDTPGGAGFSADGLAALSAADLAIVVVDPDPDRAVLAGPILRRLDEAGVPHALFVNKIDAARGTSLREILAAYQPISREPLVLRQVPIREEDAITGYIDLALERAYRYRKGEPSEPVAIPTDLAAQEHDERVRLLETLADFDDTLMETLLMDEEPDNAQVLSDLSLDTAGTLLVPVFFGSALNENGIHRLLKFLRHETPGPEQAARRMGVKGAGCYVFKIVNAGAMGRLALGRLFGGPLKEGEDLTAAGQTNRAGTLFSVQGEKFTKQAAAAAGDVVAIAKLDAARAGIMLGSKGGAVVEADPILYPPRNAVLAIAPRDRKDDVKLSTALHRLCEEDPALAWQHDDTAQETLLKGINDEHLAVVLARLERRYGVRVDTRPARIAYRESVRHKAVQRGRHKKQSGGHGQYGDCVLEILPIDQGKGFRFEDRIVGGAIPRQWIPAVEAGVRDAMEKGPLGFPVVDVAVALVDGSFHAVDSSELAFRIAGRIAMSEALAQAGPFLLEPICRVSVDTPTGTGSKAGSVLSVRRGQIVGLYPHPEWPGWERVEALVPEAGLHGLDGELRSLSQGLASFSAEFDHLAELTGRHADDVIKAQGQLAA